jgi:hypothetical protein
MHHLRKLLRLGLLLLLSCGVFQLNVLIEGVPREALLTKGVVAPDFLEGARLGTGRACRNTESVAKGVYDEGR